MKKKLLAAFLCLTMAFSLAACGDSEDAGKTDKKKDSKDDGKKVYQVATDTTFAPFEFENDEGDMVGSIWISWPRSPRTRDLNTNCRSSDSRPQSTLLRQDRPMR